MDNVTGGSGDTVTIDGRARHVSGYLRDFLFPPERLHAPVSMLSGGERNRLLLAQAVRQAEQSVGDGRAHQRSRRGDARSSRGAGGGLRGHAAAGEPRPRVSRQRRDQHAGVRGRRAHRRVRGRLQRLDAPAPSARRRGTRRRGRGPADGGSRTRPRRARRKPRKLSYKEQRELDALPRRIQAARGRAASSCKRRSAIRSCFRASPAEARRRRWSGCRRCAAELEAAYARWDALESSGAASSAAAARGPADRWDSALRRRRHRE